MASKLHVISQLWLRWQCLPWSAELLGSTCWFQVLEWRLTRRLHITLLMHELQESSKWWWEAVFPAVYLSSFVFLDWFCTSVVEVKLTGALLSPWNMVRGMLRQPWLQVVFLRKTSHISWLQLCIFGCLKLEFCSAPGWPLCYDCWEVRGKICSSRFAVCGCGRRVYIYRHIGLEKMIFYSEVIL